MSKDKGKDKVQYDASGRWVQTVAGEQSPDWRDREHYVFNKLLYQGEEQGNGFNLYRDTAIYNDPLEQRYEKGLEELTILEDQHKQQKNENTLRIQTGRALALAGEELEKERQDTLVQIHEQIVAPARDGRLDYDDGQNPQVQAMKQWLERINNPQQLDGMYPMYREETYDIPDELADLYDEGAKAEIRGNVNKLQKQNAIIKESNTADKQRSEEADKVITDAGLTLKEKEDACAKIVEGVRNPPAPLVQENPRGKKEIEKARKEAIAKAEESRDDRTFSGEVERDKLILKQTLCRPDDLLRYHVGDDEDKASKGTALTAQRRNELAGKLAVEKPGIVEEYTKEKNTADILKRLYHVQVTAGMTVVTKDGEVDASKNGLPGASYAMMGNRVVMDVDDRVGLQLANYILTGKTEVEEGVKPKDLIQNTPVFQRTIATHGLERRDGDLVETKGYGAGVKARGNHFGLNVAFGSYGENDIHGRPITTDGLSGHLYWQIGKDGRMLAGVEPCRDPSIGELRSGGTKGQYGTHFLGGSDKTGASGTRVGGIRSGKNGEKELSPRDIRLQQEKEVYAERKEEGQQDTDHSYADTEGPLRYNGLKMKVSEEQLKGISEMSADDIPVDIGSYIPAPVKNANVLQPVKHTAKPEVVDKKTLNEECAKKQKVLDDAKDVAKNARKENSLWNRFKRWVGDLVEKIEKMITGRPTTGEYEAILTEALNRKPEGEALHKEEKLVASVPGHSQAQNLSGQQPVSQEPSGSKEGKEEPVSRVRALTRKFEAPEPQVEKSKELRKSAQIDTPVSELVTKFEEGERRDKTPEGQKVRELAQNAKEKGGDPKEVADVLQNVKKKAEKTGIKQAGVGEEKRGIDNRPRSSSQLKS